MALLRFILFFILFIFVVRLIKLIARYWSSSKTTIDDLRQESHSTNPKFEDVEEAEYREINFDQEEDLDKHD